MVVILTDKIMGFSKAYSNKYVRLTVIMLQHMSTRMANLYNYTIWLTQYPYLHYDFIIVETYHVSIFCMY